MIGHLSKRIRKAVFPVAGFGTRFLPATKASPKEMLPIVDKPLIQYAVEEAVAAEIEQLIFVTNGSKRAIEDHFDKNYELEFRLMQSGNETLLKKITGMIPSHVSCVYVRQHEACGLGQAVLCAKSLIGNEPFAILLADDLIRAEPQNCLQQMISHFTSGKEGVLAIQPVSYQQVNQYGVVKTNSNGQINLIIEKPDPTVAPSNLAVIGRYILPPEIFIALETTRPDSKGEIQLTDAIASLLATKAIYAYPFKGKRYDCGNKLGFLEATLDYALLHPEFGKEFQSFLKKRLIEWTSETEPC